MTLPYTVIASGKMRQCAYDKLHSEVRLLGWQQGGRQHGDCTDTGRQHGVAQQHGRQTTAWQDEGQQVMGRQHPSCRLHGSQQTGRRQGSQMERV